MILVMHLSFALNTKKLSGTIVIYDVPLLIVIIRNSLHALFWWMRRNSYTVLMLIHAIVKIIVIIVTFGDKTAFFW